MSKPALDIHQVSRQWNEAMSYVYGISETNEEGKSIEGETVQNTAHIFTCETNVSIIFEVFNPTIDRKRQEEHEDRMDEAKWLKTAQHYKITI